MTRVTFPLFNRRGARTLTLAAATLGLLALARGASPTPAAIDRSSGSDGEGPIPRHDLQHQTDRPVRSSSPRSRRRLGRAVSLVLAAAVVSLLALVVGPATSRATIDWSSGFESQSWSPWQGLQHQENMPLSDSFQYVTSPVRTGSYAAEFTVRHGYGPYGGERTELCCGPAGEGTPGTDEYWAWSTMFPTSWTEPYKWGLFFQFHADDTMPPAIALDAGGDAVWADIRTGNISGSDTAYTNFPQILSTLSKGQWNDFVVHVHWAVDNSGSIQIWHRLAGQTDFANVLDLGSIPTLQSRGGSSTGIYTKLGLYRASYCATPAPGCTSSLGVQPTNTLYDDSLVRGSSFAEVVSSAWGGGSAAVSSSTSPPPAPSPPAPSPPAPSPPAPSPPAPSPPAPSPPAPSPPAPSPPASSPPAPPSSAGTVGTAPAPAPASTPAPASVSPAKRHAHKSKRRVARANANANGTIKAQAKAQATASARARTEAVAKAKALARTYTRAAVAAGASARGHSLAATAARAKARAYYRAAARAQAEVRALTRPKARPAARPRIAAYPS